LLFKTTSYSELFSSLQSVANLIKLSYGISCLFSEAIGAASAYATQFNSLVRTIEKRKQTFTPIIHGCGYSTTAISQRG